MRSSVSGNDDFLTERALTLAQKSISTRLSTMPLEKSIVSDDDYSDDDELLSENEDVKPGDVKSITKGGLPEPKFTDFNLRHLHGTSEFHFASCLLRCPCPSAPHCRSSLTIRHDPHRRCRAQPVVSERCGMERVEDDGFNSVHLLGTLC